MNHVQEKKNVHQIFFFIKLCSYFLFRMSLKSEVMCKRLKLVSLIHNFIYVNKVKFKRLKLASLIFNID